MDTEWWTRTGDGCHRRHPGIPDRSDDVPRRDAVWKLGRLDAAWAIRNQDSSAWIHQASANSAVSPQVSRPFEAGWRFT
jgi:hypothetical protein